MKLGIIADDFTGANDVALQLIKYGIKVKSCISPQDISGDFVYTSETRNSTEYEAKERLENLFAYLSKLNCEKIYKKIDSTLRGNIKTELEVFINNANPDEKIVVILPFPKAGRVVKDGKLYVHGTELIKTEFAQDPYWNLESSFVNDYFGGELISLDLIRSEKFYDVISHNKEKILVFEGETEDDLSRIAETLNSLGWDKNIVASAGPMDAFLDVWGYSKQEILIVAGSCNGKNIQQIESFIEKNHATVYDYFIDEDRIEYREGKDRAVSVFRTIRHEKKSEKSRLELNKLISDRVKNLCVERKIKKLCLSGGDISISFMESFGINQVEVLFEIEPGIAFGKAGDFGIVTKPGGFGSENIYEKVYSFLKNYR